VRANCIMLLLAASLLATGCGDDDDAKPKPNAGANSNTAPAAAADTTEATTATATRTSSTGPDATVRDYFIALAAREGDKACSLLTNGARRQAIAIVQTSKKTTFKSCAPALRAAVAPADADALVPADVEITKSTVDGDRAKVRVKRSVLDIELTRLRGRWYISGGFD